MSKKIFTVLNVGFGPLEITSVQIVGDNQDQFIVVEAPQTAVPIAPGESTEIVVRHLPTQAGAHSAALRIATNNPQSPLDVPLSGVGIAAA